jgi:MFS family permease
MDAASPIAVTVIITLAGAAGLVAWPTYSAILPELVPHEELPSAVALNTAQWNLGRVLGPAVAGITIAVAGYTWAFVINAATFFAVIIAVLPIVVPRPGAAEHRFLRSVRAGFGFVGRDRGLRNGITLFAINCLIAAPFIALVPAFALKVFANESPGTAILVTAQGIGAVIMAVSLGALTHRFGLRRFITVACCLLPLALVGYALSPNLAVATGAILVLGAVYLGAFTGSFTIAQTRTPRALRGRVIALFTATLSLCFPLGAIAQGWLGDRIGLRSTVLISAGLLVFAYGLFAIGSRGFLPGLDDPLAPGVPGATDEPEPPITVIPD